MHHPDISKISFDKKKRFSRVWIYQGGIFTDAMFHEQIDIHQYNDRSTASDIIGSSGCPRINGGFEIVPNEGQKGYTIKQGHYFIDGIFIENFSDVIAVSQKDNCTFEDSDQYELPNGPGIFLVFLDVKEQNIVDDYNDQYDKAGILFRDYALGDSAYGTSRSQIIWHVKLKKIGDYEDSVTNDELDVVTKRIIPESCFSVIKDLNEKPLGTLQLGTTCTIKNPSETNYPISYKEGYLGQTNQNYVFEIHSSGKVALVDTFKKIGEITEPGIATFKISRDSGSIVAQVIEMDNHRIIIDGFKRGFSQLDDYCWGEIIDRKRELSGTPGTMVKINKISETVLKIDGPIIGDPLTSHNFSQGPDLKIILWNRFEMVQYPINTDGYIECENGIRCRFKNPQKEYNKNYENFSIIYESNQYWSARVNAQTGILEWPLMKGGGTAEVPPYGIYHHYSPLAIMVVNKDEQVIRILDCRNKFESLVDIYKARQKKEMSIKVHGNAVTVLPSLDGNDDVTRKNLSVLKVVPTDRGAICTIDISDTPQQDQKIESWFYFPLTVLIPGEGKQEVNSVYLLFNIEEGDTQLTVDEIRICDGNKDPIVLNTNNLKGDFQSKITKENCWNLDKPFSIEWGLGLSVKVSFKTGQKKSGKITFSGAGANIVQFSE